MASFGHNGVALDELDEGRLEIELREKRRFHAWYPAVLVALFTAAFVLSVEFKLIGLSDDLQIAMFLTLLACTVAPSLVAQTQYAIEEFRLPRNIGRDPVHNHVSGGVVILAALLLTALLGMLRVIDLNHDRLEMGGRTGLVVVVAITLAFVLFILSPRLISSRIAVVSGRFFASVFSRRSPVGGPLNATGRAVSMIDSWLVFIVAPATGVALKSGKDRYAVLSLYITSCAALAWYFPEPFGLIPIFAWFVIAMSIARRWAWIEEDREVTLRRPRYDEQDLKVGVDEDLRDEALLALLSLILLLPLALRQIHFGFGQNVFEGTDQTGFADTLWTWLSFFGLELAKAVPFVDWADIYGVETSFVLKAESAAAHHVIFGARAVIDLVFLSALLQAISISLKLSRHKKMFFDREITMLDPMIEKIEFEKLAYKQDGQWAARLRINEFLHYDRYRLVRIRMRSKRTSAMYFIASEIVRLSDRPDSTPAEKFLEAVCQTDPMPNKVVATFESARLQNDLPIEVLAIARKALNRPEFTQVRTAIAEAIVDSGASGERRLALRAMLVGDHIDRIAAIRRLAIGPLIPLAHADHTIVQAFKHAARYDRANSVRADARNALRLLHANLRPRQQGQSAADSTYRGNRTLRELEDVD